MATPLNTIFSWFETGDYPTQEQFQASWSSFWHKDDQIPMSQITNLNELFNQTASAEALNSHITDPNAHTNYLALKDASNLSPENVNGWRVKLGVGDIPANVALVDMGQNQSVFNKDQITSLCMLLENYVGGDGKILSSKIEALGLTELITATQTSLSGFIANYQSYIYEKNDIIAIPDASGNYSLYIFKGGGKTVSSNYLPTGLTNITISMVQGLQAALDSKLDKPTMVANYVGRWGGTNFVNGVIYDNGTNVSIGAGASPTPASIFDVQGTGRVSLPAPRMTQAQRQSIALSSIAAGGLVYQTDGIAGYYLWDGTTWKTLGSNISNADLTNTSARTFTQNAAFTWDTLGNPYYWTGLIDKTTDFENFSKVLKLNPVTKEVAFGNAFIYNVPSAITVNHVNSPASPDVPSYIAAIQTRLTQLHTANMVKFDTWNITTVNNTTNYNIRVDNNDTLYTYVHNFFTDGTIAFRTPVLSIKSNKSLPRNSDWAIRFNVNMGANGDISDGIASLNITFRNIGIYTQNSNSVILPELGIIDTYIRYNRQALALQSTNNKNKTFCSGGGLDTANMINLGVNYATINCLIMKVGDNILIQMQYGSKTFSEIYSSLVIGSGDFGFCVGALKPPASDSGIGVVSNIRYYIFP